MTRTLLFFPAFYQITLEFRGEARAHRDFISLSRLTLTNLFGRLPRVRLSSVVIYVRARGDTRGDR